MIVKNLISDTKEIRLYQTFEILYLNKKFKKSYNKYLNAGNLSIYLSMELCALLWLYQFAISIYLSIYLSFYARSVMVSS